VTFRLRNYSAAVLFGAAALCQSAAWAQAQNPPPEVGMCITCHGSNGLSQLPNAPHIAGHPDIYITEQLKAYRSGKRQNEVMGVIAKTLTDAQIEVAARWYSGFKIKVQE
jgi:cytochrome c553